MRNLKDSEVKVIFNDSTLIAQVETGDVSVWVKGTHLVIKGQVNLHR